MESPGPMPGETASQGRPRPARRGYLVPGAIALVALGGLAAGINAAGLQHHRPHALSGPDVATRIAESVQTQRGLSAPPQIRCPSSEPVGSGVGFVCTLHASGGDETVSVTETGDEGSVTWRISPPG